MRSRFWRTSFTKSKSCMKGTSFLIRLPFLEKTRETMGVNTSMPACDNCLQAGRRALLLFRSRIAYQCFSMSIEFSLIRSMTRLPVYPLFLHDSVFCALSRSYKMEYQKFATNYIAAPQCLAPCDLGVTFMRNNRLVCSYSHLYLTGSVKEPVRNRM